MTTDNPEEMTNPEATLPEGSNDPTDIGPAADVPDEDLDPSRLPTEDPEVEEPAGYDERGNPVN